MSDVYRALTEKEKQTLRLVVRGHDAKSVARELGLSVHTVNERLREARRKLGVSSSREAARRLFESEGADPQFLTDKHFGDALPPASTETPAPDRTVTRRPAWMIGGVLAMSLIVALLAVQAALQPGAIQEPSLMASSSTAADDAPVRSAQAWLTLVDESRWGDSWNATGEAFRKLNTGQNWAALSEKVRRPLGVVISRTLRSHEWLPAPPHGYQVVKFRTSFANKSGTAETVTLTRDGQDWKVVGYVIG